jgi:chromosome segregation ATPase
MQEKIKDLEIALNGLKNLERDLEEDYLNRRSTWKKTYMKYFKHIDKAFREFLKEKEDFDGFIQIDPEAEKLYLQLNLKFKDDNENLNIIKDIATSQTAGEMLSGGQRCLVNVFFLLSLFSETETPFRVLDEVDVFMDQTMRTKYLEVLEEFTLDPYYENRQMIIITPQSLEGVITNDRVQIHRIR